MGGREKGLGKEGEEDRKEVKKKGRPTNVERLVRERALSVSSMEGIEEMLGRKGKKGKGRGEEREIFQRSGKTERTPEKGGERGEERESWRRELREEMKKEIKECVRECLREELRKLKKLLEVEKGMREEWRNEKEEQKKEMDEMRRAWRRDKEVMRKEMEEMEQRLWKEIGMRRTSEGKEMREGKMGGNAEERGEGGGWGREAEKLGIRIKEVERWREEQRREERRRNIVIKGMEIIGRDLKEEVRKVLERIEGGIELGDGVGIEEVRRLGKRGGAGEEMVVAKVKTIEQKARVMKGKEKLAGHKERLEDDLT